MTFQPACAGSRGGTGYANFWLGSQSQVSVGIYGFPPDCGQVAPGMPSGRDSFRRNRVAPKGSFFTFRLSACPERVKPAAAGGGCSRSLPACNETARSRERGSSSSAAYRQARLGVRAREGELQPPSRRETQDRRDGCESAPAETARALLSAPGVCRITA
jgi:hypothetical protein